jgi:CO/xanthine dehydrogenase FAD-binding subunit
LKPAPFTYHDPKTVAEAIALLQACGPDAKLLAGGQSLVPMLNMRLARPTALIDLNGIRDLAYVREEEGFIAIGAMTRHALVERSELVRRHQPLLAEAVGLIGHQQIRNRGTIGGSLVHADPAAELPAVLVALDGILVIQGPEGMREVAAADFFLMYFTTAVQPGEILTEVRLPMLAPRTGCAFMELARRHGDFALVGVATTVTLHPMGHVAAVRVALTGVGMTPVRATEAEDRLLGELPTMALLAEAALLVSNQLDPDSDLHATAEYRKQLAGVLTERALTMALQRALEGGAT